jgi:hypothetical protein
MGKCLSVIHWRFTQTRDVENVVSIYLRWLAALSGGKTNSVEGFVIG